MIVICALVIIGAVLLINLEVPPVATDTSRPVAETGDPGAAEAIEPGAPEKSAPEVNEVTAPKAVSAVAGAEVSAEAKKDAPVAAVPAPVMPVPPVPEGVPLPELESPLGAADMDYLKSRDLMIPVEGVSAKQLRDSFFDGRSEGRQHEALDIMAAQNTPVVASADGTVAKLYNSDKGGIMIYQLDESGRYYYYYAHLSRYADGLFEGKQIKRGEVIGYVGDTGNAGAGNFHLHFGISKPTRPGKWSGGAPINPYPLLVD
ncbi:MAG TPA: M23 family metallopeptidase [Blastocatellia bacterium]|nr:M23 family metallopeptidase [Blastocatellia bacterium]